ncbi:hypothetical protein FRC10_005284, partial [Ceratobasidium sp. 414]
GTKPGRALFDTPSLNTQEPAEDELSSSRRTSLRPKVPTEKGSEYKEERALFHKRSAQQSQPKSTGKVSDGYAPSTMDSTTRSLCTVPGCAVDPDDGQPGIGERSAAHVGTVSGRNAALVADTGAHARGAGAGGSAHASDAGTGAGTAAAGVATTDGTGTSGGTAHAGPAGRACADPQVPTPAPGTPSQDPSEPEYSHRVNTVDSEGEESSHHDFIEGLDPAALLAEIRRFIHFDPTTLSEKDIKAQLKLYLKDSMPAVAAPKRKTQVIMLSQDSVEVGGDGMNIDAPGPSRAKKKQARQHESSKRRKHCKRQHVTIDENKSDSEPDSPIQVTTTESEPITEPKSSTYITQDSNQPSRSSTPRPREHAPNVAPPSQPSGSRSQPCKNKPLLPPVRPPSSAAHASLPRPSRYHKPKPYTNVDQTLQREGETAAPASASANNPPDAETLRQAATLARLTNVSDRLGRVVREHHRRRQVAARAGIILEDDEQTPPGSQQIERDQVPDNGVPPASSSEEGMGGEVVGRKPKPSARDLHGYDRQIIAAAKLHLLAYSLKEGAVQPRATFLHWAGKSWCVTWRQQLPHLELQPASLMIKSILVNGLATGRGRFKDPIWPLVEFKLGFIKPPLNDVDVNRNLAIFRAVHLNAFHCTSFSPPYGHYEGDLVTYTIACTMFSTPTSIGVIHREFFKPMRLTTVAFVLAM